MCSNQVFFFYLKAKALGRKFSGADAFSNKEKTVKKLVNKM